MTILQLIAILQDETIGEDTGVIYVPNGTLTSVTNYFPGQQQRFLIPPRLVDRNETPEGGPA